MKCEHCNNDMVWEGDMLSGGLACHMCKNIELMSYVDPVMTPEEEGLKWDEYPPEANHE